MTTSGGEGDFLDLTAIDADANTAGDQAFSLVGAFSGSAGQAVLTFDAGSNSTRLLLDVNGDGQADGLVLFIGQVTSANGWLL